MRTRERRRPKTSTAVKISSETLTLAFCEQTFAEVCPRLGIPGPQGHNWTGCCGPFEFPVLLRTATNHTGWHWPKAARAIGNGAVGESSSHDRLGGVWRLKWFHFVVCWLLLGLRRGGSKATRPNSRVDWTLGERASVPGPIQYHTIGWIQSCVGFGMRRCGANEHHRVCPRQNNWD